VNLFLIFPFRPLVPLQGVTLAQSLYGAAAARVCADIDILVPASNVLPARRVIR
jgi:hypothetical protein